MRVAAFIAALIICGASGTHADESDRFTVSIRLRVDRSIASSVITDDLKDETESLWRPYGVQFEWADARATGAQAHGFSVDAFRSSPDRFQTFDS
jgi:hypothetical protein